MIIKKKASKLVSAFVKNTLKLTQNPARSYNNNRNNGNFNGIDSGEDGP